jgi:hypothetical protein
MKPECWIDNRNQTVLVRLISGGESVNELFITTQEARELIEGLQEALSLESLYQKKDPCLL